jgi:PhzF family phenazine biosynthesis protein
MATLPYRIVDAFTAVPFCGNPAAVFILDEPIPERSMQAIAAEMNLSETAFVHPAADQGQRLIRWFTPTDEVPLCGHATLASARSLLDEGEPFPLRLDSASGPLEVHREEDGRLRLDFPADPPTAEAPPAGFLSSLGLPSGTEATPLQGRNLWIVPVANEAMVRGTRPDFTAMRSVAAGTALGVAVTAPGDAPEVDFVPRFFAPWVGVDEDPVTGVAHTVLTPYWAGRLGRDELSARQLSARGGELTVRHRGDRVHLIGQAVVVAEGGMVAPLS